MGVQGWPPSSKNYLIKTILSQIFLFNRSTQPPTSFMAKILLAWWKIFVDTPLKVTCTTKYNFSKYTMRHRLRIFCIFNHPMIYQICDVMMSISTWDKAHFWIYLLNHNSVTHQTWSIGRYKGNIFLKSWEWFGGLGLSSRPFSIYQPVPITQ